MINFYKEDGIGKIAFANGDIVTPLGRVSIFVDNSTNLLVVAEDGRDKYWISTAGTLQVSGSNITGTNQQKADLIAPIFALATGSGSGTVTHDFTPEEIQFLKDLTASTTT